MQKHNKCEMLNYKNIMHPAVKITFIALANLKPWINAITEFGEITVVRLDDI